MYQIVTIKAWDGHVRVYQSGCNDFSGWRGSHIQNIDAAKVVFIGRITGSLREISGEYRLEGGCDAFCETAERLLEYSPGRIATARGQLEDLGWDTGGLSKFEDLEIAWLDWNFRDTLAELARQIDNPWQYKHQIDSDPDWECAEYIKRMCPQ